MTFFLKNIGKVLLTISAGNIETKGQLKTSHLTSRVMGSKFFQFLKKKKFFFFDVIIKSTLNKRMKNIFFKLKDEIFIYYQFFFKRVIFSIVKNHNGERIRKKRRV